MDNETRKEWEHYCALAEIEENPDKFGAITREVVRLLDEKQVRLNRERSAHEMSHPSSSSRVA